MKTQQLPRRYNKSDFLPTSKEEIEFLGWEQPDIILFSGDAYVDHPSFGAAVIGRTLQAAGYKVAIVPQPNWRDDLRDFKKLGKPRLFFGVSAGAMDSMVNHYTANRRLRHDDAYTPGGRHGMRPDYPTIVYSQILEQLYPDVPIIAGGIEASLRRVAHYDYWQDRLRPSIIADSKVDMIIYGMGEKAIVEIANRLDDGESLDSIDDVPQTLFFTDNVPCKEDIVLHSYENCLKEKSKQAENFKLVEIESNRMYGHRIFQSTGGRMIQINPMYPPLTTKEVDASFDLPYTRIPHPRYRGKIIPAYEMIRHSVCMHRGCFGGCAFCTISAHQGKFISSRSKNSIMREVRQVVQMDDFKGYISDLGGPSANMYAMGGKDKSLCALCARPSCLHPSPCRNLNNDHRPLLDIYRTVDALHDVKKSFIGSGVRYDLSMADNPDKKIMSANRDYLKELIEKHVSGRLKVAPEHTSDRVLDIMRKPSFQLFRRFKTIFDNTNKQLGLKQQLIPYFISSHPGCLEEDMAELAVITKNLDFHLEQVQDFTPTPMTLATEIYYTGIHPYTGKRIYTAKTEKQKLAQRDFFFWYKPEARSRIVSELKKMHRTDLLARLYDKCAEQRAKERKRKGTKSSSKKSR
ncbi:MAG: YgiQ family radical SAM protein [Prevotella sp.]|nr:YgiQ family radical SAM protein [Bacteroides sp.]MCM1365640.1 YgiQ family radical SAM protein [Prevotella sp.]